MPNTTSTTVTIGSKPGPLSGLRVLELNGVGPTPFAGMMLSDLGATVLRIDRVGDSEEVLGAADFDILSRGRRSICLDLKAARAQEIFFKLVSQVDVLIEGFRPGVCERLGIGPDTCRQINPQLIFARMTGWGQEGPLAPNAGHDINYLAEAGALHSIGVPELPPIPPLNFVADFGGGGMLVVVGVLAAVYERARSGQGQVVDAAMVDGVAIQSAQLQGLIQGGSWTEQRADNKLDGGAPFYRCYETSDQRYMAVSALEGKFYGVLLGRLGLSIVDWPQQDKKRWPLLEQEMSRIFGSRTRAMWIAEFAGVDACVSPVLTPTEARNSAHSKARGSYVDIGGLSQPAPAPRFSRTQPRLSEPPVRAGQHTVEILREIGLSGTMIDDLMALGVTRQGEQA